MVLQAKTPVAYAMAVLPAAPAGTWMARLMEPFITPAVQKKMDNDLEQLKKLAETAPAQSALR